VGAGVNVAEGVGVGAVLQVALFEGLASASGKPPGHDMYALM